MKTFSIYEKLNKLYGRRVSCHLMVQPELSQLMLSNHGLIAQGLLSRCLVTGPESTAGTRFYCEEEDLSASPEITQYNARILAIIEHIGQLRIPTITSLVPMHRDRVFRRS